MLFRRFLSSRASSSASDLQALLRAGKKAVCVGKNFRDHISELAQLGPEWRLEEEPEPVEAPSAPLPAPPSAARAAKPKRQAKQRADAPPKRAVRTAPPPAPRPPDRVPGPLLNEASLLDIMKAGLAHARTKHKADKVARYDAMFAY